MWIFTVNGFFTVIQDRKDADYVWLRSRLREDIERNFPGVTAEEHPGADYLYRVKLPREQVAERLFELTMENNVTSHFKDVMIKTASKPQFGSRSRMLYGVWNAGAEMQPIPPYSKFPRKAPSQRSTKGSQQSGQGRRDLTPYTYGGAGAARYGSEFDWDRQDWGGTQQRDPAFSSPQVDQEPPHDGLSALWGDLPPEERARYLDEYEAYQRRKEEWEEDHGAAARAYADELETVEVVDILPSPRNRPGNRKQRRKAKRANRHNQDRTAEQYAQYARERREGKHGKQQQDRQAFLDKQKIEKGA